MSDHPAALESEVRTAAARLDRRGFLRLAGAAAAGGLLPTGCGAAPAHLLPDPDLALRVLSPRGFAVLNAAAEVLTGDAGGRLVRERRVVPARIADEFLAASPELAGPLQQALWVLEFGVFPLVAKLRPFTALPTASRTSVLDDLMRSQLSLKRTLFKGVRSIALLSFYSAPEAQARTGMPRHPGDGVAIADAMTYRVGD